MKKEIIDNVRISFSDGTVKNFHDVEVMAEENHVVLGKQKEDGDVTFDIFPYHTVNSIKGNVRKERL